MVDMKHKTLPKYTSKNISDVNYATYVPGQFLDMEAHLNIAPQHNGIRQTGQFCAVTIASQFGSWHFIKTPTRTHLHRYQCAHNTYPYTSTPWNYYTPQEPTPPPVYFPFSSDHSASVSKGICGACCSVCGCCFCACPNVVTICVRRLKSYLWL